MRFKITGERVISVDDFRSALGLSDKYPEFKILKRAVIKPALAELNFKSDIDIEYEETKKGRAVASLIFTFTAKHPITL